MKPETVDRIMRTIDAQMQRLGAAKNWDEAMEFGDQFFQKLFSMIPDRAQLEKSLSDEPEPDPDELERTLQAFEGMWGFFRKQIPELVKKEIPHSVGGRPSVLGTPQEQKHRIQQVLLLIGEKVKTIDALKRVAEREGISLSSMQRIWRRRDNLNRT